MDVCHQKLSLRRANTMRLTAVPAWCSYFSFAIFLLEWKKYFPHGLEGFYEQAEGESIVDIKLFLLKGIVVTRWSSHHSK